MFRTTIFDERNYFDRPLSQSRFFRGNAIGLVVSIAIAVGLLFFYTFAIPNAIAILSLITGAVLNLVLTWFRYVSNHKRLMQELSNHETKISDEFLTAAARQINCGYCGAFLTTFFLFLALLLVLGQYERQNRQRTQSPTISMKRDRIHFLNAGGQHALGRDANRKEFYVPTDTNSNDTIRGDFQPRVHS